MGMTIDDTLTGLYALREFLKHSEFEGLEEQTKAQIQIVTDAIDTMRKYQKVTEIIANWNDKKINNIICCLDIKEVIEDGNDLSSGLAKNSKKLEKDFGELDCINRSDLLKAMDTWDKFGYTETGCFVREPKGAYVPYVRYEDMVNCVKGMPSVIPEK